MAIIEQQTDPKDDIVASRDSEVWNQVGMLEEEINMLGNNINVLCASLEAAGVLEPPTPGGREEAVEEDPQSCIRLGRVVQNMRHALGRYNECVCVLTSRLGV